MLLAIYKEMKDKLSLIDVAGNSALVVMSVLAFSVTFAKMTYVLKFVLFKLQQAPTTKAKFFFCLISSWRKLYVLHTLGAHQESTYTTFLNHWYAHVRVWCVLGSKKCYSFGKLCVRTLWMAHNIVFVDASMMHLIAIILRIFREKSWFGLATNYKKMC